MSDTVVIASAGAGKTTHLVSEALADPKAKILLTTYTIENLENIREEIVRQRGYVPSNVIILTWYSFLLMHGVRPYQNLISGRPTAKSIVFDVVPPALRYVKRDAVDQYFFTRDGYIYRDRVSDFVALADDQTGGLIVRRLEKIFSHIFIDEIQDLAGYDLVLYEKLLRSAISTMGVGDPRQATFSTNNSKKNKAFAGAGVVDWVRDRESEGLLDVVEKNQSWRCNQAICDFADGLFPGFTSTKSLNETVTGHDGIFVISPAEVPDYVALHQPSILRWDRNAKTMGLPGMNIGISKGRSFDRVLIFPTKPMRTYLVEKDVAVAGDLTKFYVAVTRARFSVSFVM